MVGKIVDDGDSPLVVYNRLRIITRQFLLSQVFSTPMKVTRRRMQPRAGEVGQRPSVCRRLFADEEDTAEPAEAGARDNMLNQINEQINRDLDDACKKYNFDFRNEVPLEGDFQWERIPPDGEESVPDNLEVPPPAPRDPKDPTGTPEKSNGTPEDPVETPKRPQH